MMILGKKIIELIKKDLAWAEIRAFKTPIEEEGIIFFTPELKFEEEIESLVLLGEKKEKEVFNAAILSVIPLSTYLFLEPKERKLILGCWKVLIEIDYFNHGEHLEFLKEVQERYPELCFSIEASAGGVDFINKETALDPALGLYFPQVPFSELEKVKAFNPKDKYLNCIIKPINQKISMKALNGGWESIYILGDDRIGISASYSSIDLEVEIYQNGVRLIEGVDYFCSISVDPLAEPIKATSYKINTGQSLTNQHKIEKRVKEVMKIPWICIPKEIFLFKENFIGLVHLVKKINSMRTLRILDAG